MNFLSHTPRVLLVGHNSYSRTLLFIADGHLLSLEIVIEGHHRGLRGAKNCTNNEKSQLFNAPE